MKNAMRILVIVILSLLLIGIGSYFTVDYVNKDKFYLNDQEIKNGLIKTYIGNSGIELTSQNDMKEAIVSITPIKSLLYINKTLIQSNWLDQDITDMYEVNIETNSIKIFKTYTMLNLIKPKEVISDVDLLQYYSQIKITINEFIIYIHVSEVSNEAVIDLNERWTF